MTERLAVDITVFVDVDDNITEAEMDRVAAGLADSAANLDGVCGASAGTPYLVAR